MAMTWDETSFPEYESQTNPVNMNVSKIQIQEWDFNWLVFVNVFNLLNKYLNLEKAEREFRKRETWGDAKEMERAKGS